MAEIALYESKILVPDTVLKVEHLFYADMAGDAHTTEKRGKAVEEKIRAGMSKGHLGDLLF
jgi:hypothetical protein